MNLDKTKIAHSIEKWENSLNNSRLPAWEDLPALELYMDQVITLLEQYLSVFGGGKIITQSMINNYVKLGIMPPPVKKRYSRRHLAYLIIICFLKQTLNMETIRKFLPTDAKEEMVKEIYRSFAANTQKAFAYVVDNVKKVAIPVLGTDSDMRMNDFLIQVSITSNICKVLTEEITSDGEGAV